jgi:hypothetical protein
MSVARERILKAAMEAACDEAERLGYRRELGYVEAASIGEKAAGVALDQLAGAVEALESIHDKLEPFVKGGEPAAEDAVDIYEIADHALNRFGVA